MCDQPSQRYPNRSQKRTEHRPKATVNGHRLLSTLAALAIVVLAAAPGAAQDATLPITFSSFNSDPAPRAFEEAVVREWNEAHPEQPVLHSIIFHEDFKQAIRAYLVARPSPDVLTWFAGNRARFFIDRGLIADLTDVWEANGFAEVLAPGFDALARVNGVPYFLPTSTYWWAVYYRPSLFQQAGITEVPETWAEFLAACDRLNEAGITPITIGARFRWPAAGWFDYLNMRQNGPQFHIDLMDLKESYTDPRVKATFARWQELFDHDCFIDDPAALDWQEAVGDMVQGRAAMMLMGAFIRDSYPDEAEADLDFFQFPIIDPALPVGIDAPTNGYFMAASSPNPDNARDFLAYLGSREVQQRAFEMLGRLPTRIDVDLSDAPAHIRKGIELIQSADVVAQFYDRDTPPPMAEAGMDAFMRFWDDPTRIDTILAELDVERQRILAEEAAAGA